MKRSVALMLAASLLAVSHGAGAIVQVPGWIPGNAGVMWWQGASDLGIPPRQPVGEGSGAKWFTRRLGVSPTSDQMHLGSFFHGLYVSSNGAAWLNLMPGCLLPAKSPVGADEAYQLARALAVASTGIDVCGVEGIAYDPLLPQRMYVSGYDVSKVSTGGASLGTGGVYVSDDRGGHWRKLLGGIRGNGLAVSRSGAGPATIVAGYIQQDNGNVGSTPGGGSLSVSSDDGSTWRSVVLPASGCSDIVVSSQRITPTVVVNPADPKTIYAGTNAGLYVSTDTGKTWTLARKVCGGVWGIAVSANGSDLYIGDFNGVVSAGSKNGTGFTTLTDLGSSRVQQLVLDADGRRLYASMWDGGSANVYRIDASSGASNALGDSLLGFIDEPLPDEFPRPFPLVPGDGEAPSLFLARTTGRLQISTVMRGTFLRAE